MPKLPTYDRSAGLGGGATASYASDGAFTAPGRALAGLGAAVANLGDRFDAETQKVKDTTDDAWFSKARAQTATDMIAVERELQQSATGEAGGYMTQVGQRYQELRNQRLAEAPSPRAQQMYTQWADGFGVDVTARSSRFQAESEIAKRTTDFAEAMNAHSQTIYADPSQYDAVYKRAQDDFNGARQWMTPEQEAKAWESVDRNLKLARAKSLAMFNPDVFLQETGRPQTARGGSGSIVDRIIGAESGGNPNAQNSRSSAGGAGGFIDSTWVGMIRKYRPDLAAGASNDDIISMKTDGALSREMVERLVEENSAGLRKAGFEASDRNLYLAHFAGVEGAKKLLSADDNTPVSSLTSQQVMDANPNLKGKTVGDLKAWADKKVGVSGPSAPQQDFPVVVKGNSLTGRRFAPDLNGVQPDVMNRFKSLQNAFGASIPIVSGFRDNKRNLAAGGAKQSQHMGGNALDLDVSDLSRVQIIQLIKQARAAGFGGIGVYGDRSLHVDIGPVRAWGPSHYSDSIPAWAKEALDTPVGTGATAEAAAPSGPGPSFATDPRYAGLSVDEIISLQNGAQQRVSARQSTEYASIKDQLELGIATGEITSESQILGSGLNGGDQATLLGKLRTATEESRGLAEAWTAFKDGTLSLDSYETKDRTLVDKMEDSLIKTAEQNAPDAAPNQTGGLGRTVRSIWVDEMVRQTGIVPKGTVSDINRGLESRNPADVAAAAARASRISQIDPSALSKRDNGSKAADAAVLFDHYTSIGLSEEDAAKRLIDAKDPEKVKARKALMDSEPAKKFLKDKADESTVRDIFDPGLLGFDPQLGETPAQAAKMVGEYRDILEESLYDANGDPEAAKALADQRFGRIYSPSDFTFQSGVVSRRPIELTYPADKAGSHEYVREQAIMALKEAGIDTPTVYFQSDTFTDADVKAGRPARYIVYYEKDGAIERYQFPFSATPPAVGGSMEDNRARWQENRSQLEAGRDREQTLDNFLNGNPLTGQP